MSDFESVDQQSFDKSVLKSSLPVLVDFGATWCVPCKRLEPILEKLADAWQGKARFVKVDVDESPDLAARFGVMSVPTVILFKGGAEQQRTNGLQPMEKLTEKFTPYL